MKSQEEGSPIAFEKKVMTVGRWFERLGLIGLAAMALAALADVVGSKLFGLPLPGSTEITGMLQVMAIASGLALSQLDGKQIRVDVVTELLPRRVTAVLYMFGGVLGVIFFAIAAWMLFELGLSLLSSSTKTLLLGIPLAPFALWASLCCVPMCFAIVVEITGLAGRLTR